MNPEIYKLEDEELVAALVNLSTHQTICTTRLTAWEREFIFALPSAYIKKQSITWKQRKAAREILSKVQNQIVLAETLRRLAAQ